MTKITITPYLSNYSKRYDIRDENNRIGLFVLQDAKYNFQGGEAINFQGGETITFNEPVINWPGCGDKTTEQAKLFIELLSIAVQIARDLELKLNPKNGIYSEYFIDKR